MIQQFRWSVHCNNDILLGPQYLHMHSRMQDHSKEIMAESQRVSMQLRNLEKQLKDLNKLAAQKIPNLSESDKLTQELQLIEQGIHEKQKEARLVGVLFIAVSL